MCAFGPKRVCEGSCEIHLGNSIWNRSSNYRQSEFNAARRIIAEGQRDAELRFLGLVRPSICATDEETSDSQIKVVGGLPKLYIEGSIPFARSTSRWLGF
jgi:hypothetical protein